MLNIRSLQLLTLSLTQKSIQRCSRVSRSQTSARLQMLSDFQQSESLSVTSVGTTLYSLTTGNVRSSAQVFRSILQSATTTTWADRVETTRALQSTETECVQRTTPSTSAMTSSSQLTTSSSALTRDMRKVMQTMCSHS